MPKVKLFTHTDLDGYGCRILAERFVGIVFESVDVTHVDNHEVNDKIMEFINSGLYENYDLILITDISVNEKVAKLLDILFEEEKIKDLALLDHHKTALFLNDYEWAEVRLYHPIFPNIAESGTSLLYSYLQTAWNASYSIRDFVFVEMVRKYDTWEWQTKYNDIIPKRLNDLFLIYRGERFVKHISHYLNRVIDEIFGETENLLLDLEQERIDDYVKSKSKGARLVHVDKYKVLVVGADKYHSELGNRLAQKFPEADLVAIIDINQKKMSFRTIKEGIDLSEFAKRYGGGGHAKSSGAPLNDSAIELFLTTVFSY
jgi:uncharacterized protein